MEKVQLLSGVLIDGLQSFSAAVPLASRWQRWCREVESRPLPLPSLLTAALAQNAPEPQQYRKHGQGNQAQGSYELSALR
jgi:hypothetical protein